MGALIVVGDGPDVLGICSGDSHARRRVHPAAAVRAGQDGRRHHPGCRRCSRIALANVHLVPSLNVPTTETGTRHRTKPSGWPGRSRFRSSRYPRGHVEDHLSLGENKHPLDSVARLIGRANPVALQTLERWPRIGFDTVTNALSALEVEDLVTVRDVVTVLQRAEMVRRIAEEVEGYIVELGSDGRLARLQLDEVARRRGGRASRTWSGIICPWKTISTADDGDGSAGDDLLRALAEPCPARSPARSRRRTAWTSTRALSRGLSPPGPRSPIAGVGHQRHRGAPRQPAEGVMQATTTEDLEVVMGWSKAPHGQCQGQVWPGWPESSILDRYG